MVDKCDIQDRSGEWWKAMQKSVWRIANGKRLDCSLPDTEYDSAWASFTHRLIEKDHKETDLHALPPIRVSYDRHRSNFLSSIIRQKWPKKRR